MLHSLVGVNVRRPHPITSIKVTRATSQHLVKATSRGENLKWELVKAKDVEDIFVGKEGDDIIDVNIHSIYE